MDISPLECHFLKLDHLCPVNELVTKSQKKEEWLCNTGQWCIEERILGQCTRGTYDERKIKIGSETRSSELSAESESGPGMSAVVVVEVR